MDRVVKRTMFFPAEEEALVKEEEVGEEEAW